MMPRCHAPVSYTHLDVYKRQPLNDDRNSALYEQYVELAKQEGNVVFAGRLGGYKYYDMDKAIDAAFDLVNAELGVDLRK